MLRDHGKHWSDTHSTLEICQRIAEALKGFWGYFCNHQTVDRKKYMEFFFFKISDQKLDFMLALSYLNPALNNLAQ